MVRSTSLFSLALLGMFCFVPGESGPVADAITPAHTIAPEEAEAELSEAIHVHELKAHVYRLASPEFMGRRGAGAARASRHLAAAFERLKLEPAFDGSYFQPIPNLLADEAVRDRSFLGRNVGAVLPGSDPKLKDEWIVLSAHFDHLGKDGDHYYPGADDNASGVAMLLEVAERFALQKQKPKRTMVFVAFDLEETGLQGSTHFATKPPRDFKKLKAALTADMLGRSMANLMDEHLFTLGSESAPQLRKLIEEVKPPKGLTIARMGADLVGTRSDYGPFRDRRIPFLFFSTGQHPDYHRTTDLPDRIDYEKLQRNSVWISDLAWRLANDAEAPVWDDKPPTLDLDEARTVMVLVSRSLEASKKFTLNDQQRTTVAGVRDRLEGILSRGKITAAERSWLVWTARMLLVTVY
ncbi:MAG: M20/M25/M40 family metallo-hydrolase [Gemmataceae bacterium]|nr:M20/M25/M40 family metallo-hydrolase [Gemmataceae bacterium]